MVTEFNWLENMPWLRLLAYIFLSTVVLGNIATYLRKKLDWADGYSRKINHFGHMVISTPLLAFLPLHQLLPAICLGSLLVILIYGVAAQSRVAWVNGIVAGSLRDRDRPRAKFFFFFPLISGNVALVTAAFIYPIDLVRLAFFTVAFADGFAEPIGLKFGSLNSFRVFDPIWGGHNTKSVAGSCAVFFWSLVIALTLLSASHDFDVATFSIGIVYAGIITLIEALSPRGLDNMLLLGFGPLIMLALRRLAY